MQSSFIHLFFSALATTYKTPCYKEIYRKVPVKGHQFAGLKTIGSKTAKTKNGRETTFVTTYHPAVKKLKQIVIENWSLIENRPLLKTIFKTLRSSLTKVGNL